jgi:4-amino-4-deoxy-L-arabinose transferase-like glycosyltransferase
VKIAIGVGLTVLAIAIAAVLSQSPLVVIGSNAVPASKRVIYEAGGKSFCQPGGTLPPRTSAVRISAIAKIGPTVSVQMLSGTHVVAQGRRAAGWGDAETVTIPLTPVSHAVPNARLCVKLGPFGEGIALFGASTEMAVGNGRVETRKEFRIEYLRTGRQSWWSLIPGVVRRMGFGHAPASAWAVFLLAAMMVAVAVLALRLLIRATGRKGTRPRPRAAALTCALIACLNATCWSLITPPFQSPDEPSHFAYVQQIAQTDELPTSQGNEFSPAEMLALRDLHQPEVQWHPGRQPIESAAEEQQLQADLAMPLSRAGTGGAGLAATEPPLYYALQTVPYELASSGSLLDQLELMRLLSALMAGVTALFVYLFIRETLPRVPWAWTVGGVSVALMPLLGFMSGVVNPDSMLYAVSAAIFYMLARGFQRGLTLRLATAIGVVSAIGLLTKLNFAGLYPGVLIGMVVLTWQVARSSRRGALLCLLLALGLSASPIYVYAIANALSSSLTLGVASTATGQASQHGSLPEALSYIWQLYLPRLPGMTNHFPGISSPRQIWFDRSVGFYGWLDTFFPAWVENLALVTATLVACLGLRTLLALRRALRRRMVELVVYALMGGGLLALVGLDSFIGFPTQVGAYSEPRYLLPLLPLFGAALALAARGAGRRWGPVAGALLVVSILSHDIFSQLQTIARFYG